jgi:6-pyruvoyltetrahydropterin/6-carboxytetrahydropterin synthase
MSFVLRFTRRFSMAHRLIAGQSDKCATPHGHNELVTVDLVADVLGRPGQRPTELLGRPGQRPTELLGRPGQRPTELLGRPGQRPTEHATPLDGDANMVAEFARAKGRWHRFVDEHLDHALQLSEHDPLLAIADAQFPGWRIVVTPGDPTTELLAALLAAKCQRFLDADTTSLRVARVTIEETPTNSVVFEGDPRDVLPARDDAWWWRADDSTRG